MGRLDSLYNKKDKDLNYLVTNCQINIWIMPLQNFHTKNSGSLSISFPLEQEKIHYKWLKIFNH